MKMDKQDFTVVIAADVFSGEAKNLEVNLSTPCLALAKVNNRSIICNSLDSLMSWNIVTKIFVLTKSELIKSDIEQNILESPYYDFSSVSVNVQMLPPDVENYGDVLREVDGKNSGKDENVINECGDSFLFVRGPFVLVCNGLITALEQHKERRRVAKKTQAAYSPVMTLVFKPVEDAKDAPCLSHLFGESSNWKKF